MKNNGLDTTQHPTPNTAQDGSKKGLPPHIIWPVFVVGLLVTSVIYSMSVVFASQSDGGVQVIDNYYEKAVDWDKQVALQHESDATGWEATLTFKPAGTSSEAHGLLLHVKNADANTLSGFQGVIRAKRPQTSGTVTELTIQETSITPEGSYLLSFAQAERGLWDFELDFVLDDVRFTKTIRKELVY